MLAKFRNRFNGVFGNRFRASRFARFCSGVGRSAKWGAGKYWGGVKASMRIMHTPIRWALKPIGWAAKTNVGRGVIKGLGIGMRGLLRVFSGVLNFIPVDADGRFIGDPDFGGGQPI